MCTFNLLYRLEITFEIQVSTKFVMQTKNNDFSYFVIVILSNFIQVFT